MKRKMFGAFARVMQLASIGLTLFLLIVTSAPAGTWRDTFEDGNYKGWEIWNENGKWKVKGGELIGENQSGIAALYMGDENWSNYTVQVDVMIARQVGAPDFPQAGISVRNHFPLRAGHYEFIFVQLFGVWNIMANHVTPGWADNVKIAVGFPVEQERWYTFKMVVDGKTIQAYVDNKIITEFTDDSELTGKVALHVKGTETHFDNVMITGDNIPDGGSPSAVNANYKLATTWGKMKRDRHTHQVKDKYRVKKGKV